MISCNADVMISSPYPLRPQLSLRSPSSSMLINWVVNISPQQTHTMTVEDDLTWSTEGRPKNVEKNPGSGWNWCFSSRRTVIARSVNQSRITYGQNWLHYLKTLWHASRGTLLTPPGTNFFSRTPNNKQRFLQTTQTSWPCCAVEPCWNTFDV